jgi:hypothetical protein
MVTSVIQNGVTLWSGAGEIPLPFNEGYVQVEWTNMTITADGNLCGGTVKGVADAPAAWPNLNPGPAIFGTAICQSPPSQPGFDSSGVHSETGEHWDPYGFNEDGQYVKHPPYPDWQPGMPYDSLLDPNGFDADGNHFETGTPFGPDGCSINGLTAAGDTCTPGNGIPYYWLQNSNNAALELANSVNDSLNSWINGTLSVWQGAHQDSVSHTETACAGIRTTLEGLLVALNYSADRELIFGPGDLYFAKGM